MVVGMTVIVNVLGVPAHELAVGVTVMVAVTGELVVLVAVNVGSEPAPDAASPMAVLLLVQANVVPPIGLVKEISEVVAPLQYMVLATEFTVVVGLTVIVKVLGVPGHE